MLDLCRTRAEFQDDRVTKTRISVARTYPNSFRKTLAAHTTDLFLSTAVKYEQAREAADNRDWKATKHVNLNALSKKEPGLISRGEFKKLNTEVRNLKMQQQREKNEKQSPALYRKTHFQPNGR